MSNFVAFRCRTRRRWGRLFLCVILIVAGQPFQFRAADQPLPRERSPASEQELLTVPVAELEKAAADGNLVAMFILGRRYDLGEGVERDDAKALSCYQKAAAGGYAMAQNNLGVFFQQGRGIPRDQARAVFWFRKSAEQGEAYGQSNLSWAYQRGLGVAKNREQAEYWCLQAAEQGLAIAQFNLARMNESEGTVGNSRVGNYQTASEWYEKAAGQGHVESMFRLGELYFYGKIQRSYPEALKWFRRAAEAGHAIAALRLGEFYQVHHVGLPADLAEAERWFRIAAREGNSDAQFRLGELLRGHGGPDQVLEAERWLGMAADNGSVQAASIIAARRQFSHEPVPAGVAGLAMSGLDPQSALALARAYETGLGQPVDLNEAVEWYARLINLGLPEQAPEALSRLVALFATGKTHFQTASRNAPRTPSELAELIESSAGFLVRPDTQTTVGEMYLAGKLLPQDTAAAADWLARAAKDGDAAAIRGIGWLWESGAGGTPDPSEAVLWYRQAAERGDAAAQLRLGRALRDGFGTPTNRVEAYSWFRLSARQGNAEAGDALAQLSSLISAEERSRAEDRVSDVLRRQPTGTVRPTQP